MGNCSSFWKLFITALTDLGKISKKENVFTRAA
jgi:hypothetical protein